MQAAIVRRLKPRTARQTGRPPARQIQRLTDDVGSPHVPRTRQLVMKG